MVEQFSPNKIVTFQEYDTTAPRIVTERVYGINIGRAIFPVMTLTKWEPNSTALNLLNALNGNLDMCEATRSKIRFSLNNNTSNEYPVIKHERAVSAYFTHSPNDKTVIIEWGSIDPNSKEAKLHSYLNRMINYQERVNNGMKLSSGHLAKLEDMFIALFDNITKDTSIKKDTPLGETINTLYHYGIIPITAEGYLRLPAF